MFLNKKDLLRNREWEREGYDFGWWFVDKVFVVLVRFFINLYIENIWGLCVL